MAKFKITNESQKHSEGKRNVFLTEAGKLIKPGEHCVCNRLDNGTQSMVDAGILSVEQGDFVIPSVFADTTPPKADTSDADAAAKAAADAKAASDAKAAEQKAAADAAEAEAKAAADAAAADVDANANATADEDAPTPDESSSKKSRKNKRG